MEIDFPLVWDANWGKCGKRFLEGKMHTCPLLATDFIGLGPQSDGTDRLPLLCTDLKATRKVFGLVYPDELDLDMIVRELGINYPKGVISRYLNSLIGSL